MPINRCHYLSRTLALLVILAASAAPAGAACSRTIVVPASPTGYSVIASGAAVSGAIPDMLRTLGARDGCTFAFPVMPRARMAYQFLQSGEADIMVPASRSAERDLQATFVPMMKWKVELIALTTRAIGARSVEALLADKQLRGVFVRSYVFGDAYNAMLRQLEAERRIYYANDLAGVARMLKAGRADFTVNVSALFLSTLASDAAMQADAALFAAQPLAGMPLTESGAYVSRRSLKPADQAALRALLAESAHGALWQQLQKYYPPALLKSAVQPH